MLGFEDGVEMPNLTHHVRHNNIHDGPKYSLTSSCQADGLRPQRWGRDFSEKSKGNDTDGDLVDQSINHGARRLDPASSRSMHNVQNAHEHHYCCHTNHTPDEELSATNGVDDAPGNDDANNSACSHTDAEVECMIEWDARKLKEVCREPKGKYDAREMLTCEYSD